MSASTTAGLVYLGLCVACLFAAYLLHEDSWMEGLKKASAMTIILLVIAPIVLLFLFGLFMEFLL